MTDGSRLTRRRFPAFRAGAVDSPRMKFEPERPQRYKPSAGLDAAQTVRARPGEKAKLELRIVGPVVNPVVSFGGVECRFAATLGANDVLRCTNGRDWRVTHVKRGSRDIVAEGRLERAIPDLSGAMDVRMSSSDDANADARISIAKRYAVR